jgi:hypothetical protein
MNNIKTQIKCTVCSNHALTTIIHFGLHTPANRFVTHEVKEHEQERYPLGFGYCSQCGTMQLTHRMPVEAVRPQYKWLTYNEPEGHLNEVAAQLTQLPGINSKSRVLGITYKDQSTIDRLASLGISHGICISEHDFDFQLELFGLETIQQILRNAKTVSHIKDKYGVADILLMRHIIEHAENAAELILSLRSLLTKDGYLVLELPDSEQIIQSDNHAFIWEEHISYFTEQTLATLAKTVGATLAWFQRCSYPYEDSLLVAFRFSTDQSYSGEVSKDNNAINSVSNELIKFKSALEGAKQQWRKKIMDYHEQGVKTAVFGAGHLAAKFINFYEIKDLIDCVIDDNVHKTGMKMPGSLVPIVSSQELSERGIKICISTLSPESEIKVRQKLSAYFINGGIFLPAFTVSRDLS